MKPETPLVLSQSAVCDPELSILIPAHNAAVWISDTVASVRRQPGVRTELVIIDDGSSDETRKRLLALQRDDMTLLAFDRNQGCGAARNLALPFARAPWICPFDADDLMLPNRLAPFFHFVQSQTHAFWGCCGVLIAEADGTPRSHAMGQPFDTVAMLGANIVNHGMSLIRRDFLEKSGGYDSTVARGIDYSMMLKLTLRGSPVFYNEIGYLYRMTSSGITHSKEYPLEQIHTLYRQWLILQRESGNNAERAAHLLRILDLHQAVRRADWPAVNTLCERIRLDETDSFECEKYRILSLVMTKQFEEASKALQTRHNAHGSEPGLTGLTLRKHQAALRWLVDQALRLAAGAHRTELLPTFLPQARLLQQAEPTPTMQKLIAACGGESTPK